MLGPILKINSHSILSQNEGGSLVNDEELNKIITMLETDIMDGSWLHKKYSNMDMALMPALVMQANMKYPEMNLCFIKSPQELPAKLRSIIEHRMESSRFIINLGEDQIHFAVIDCKHVNEKTSLILLEPANFNSLGPSMLALRTKLAIEREGLPNCNFSMMEMDIQRSSSECGIFSLALAKKLYKEAVSMLEIHEKNMNGMLGDSNIPLPHDKLDPYLPVTFYKHTQGRRRLNEYLNANPQAVNTIVNKKNETIMSRFDMNLSTIDGKNISISAHNKRIIEYKTLLKS